MTTYTTLSNNPVFRAGLLSFLAFALLVASSSPALALDLCTLIDSLFYNNNIGKGIATMGVLTLGISATFGKVSWGMAVLVAVGIAAIFGAGTLAISAGGGCTGH